METASMQQSKPNFTLQCRRFLAAVNRRAGQGRAGQGRAGQGRAGQGRAGQGRAGQGRAKQTDAMHDTPEKL